MLLIGQYVFRTEKFNQADKWNVSNVRNMFSVFAETKKFNQSLNN